MNDASLFERLEKIEWKEVDLKDKSPWDENCQYRIQMDTGGDFWWESLLFRNKETLGFATNSTGWGYKIAALNKTKGIYFQIGDWKSNLKETIIHRIQRRF
jgi:hypothetical protein